MKKELSALKYVVGITLALCFTHANSASVKVKWTDPDSYADIHHGDDFKESYREWLFFNLDKHFTKLAEKLPADQHLDIEVLNLDLAGDVHRGSIDLIRIVENRYPPRILMRYSLMTKDKQVISSDEVKLRDTAFMTRGSIRAKRSSLGYEKKMLDDWFKDTFIQNK